MTNVSVRISVGSISGTTYTSTEQITIPSSEIVKNSCELTRQLMKDLSPTVDQCKFEVVKDSPAVEWILNKDTDIRAVVYENDTIIFTGYLSDKYKWSVTSNGESTLSVTAEDFNKLLSKVYAPSDGGDVLLNGSTSTIIPNICLRAGINAVNIPSYNITKVVSSGTTCKDLLKEICFEGGYVYYFTAEGNLTVTTLLPSSLTSVATLNNDDLYVVNSTAISLSKSLQQYRQANIAYTKIATRNNVLVYQDISGRDSTHPNCNIEIAGGYAYPSGIAIGSHTDDELKCTISCTDLDKGMELVYIDNVKPEVTSVGTVEYSITKRNAKDLDVLVKNSTTLSKTLSKLQAKADITYIASNEKVIAGLGTSDDDKVYEYDCKYIHEKSLAENLAKKIANYYKYCNYQYTFYSKQDLTLGQIVTLIDDTFSGLNVKVMPFKKVLTKNIYTYMATSVSEFDIETKSGQSIIPSSNVNPIVGESGKAGKGIFTMMSYYLASERSDIGNIPPSYVMHNGSKSPSTQVLSEDKPYLLYCESTLFTDGTIHTSEVTMISKYAKDGAAGVGITDVKEKYAVNNDKDNAPTTWYDTPQTMDTNNRFLWNYEIVVYSNSQEVPTNKRIIGVYGDDGDTGNGVKGITNYYLATDLATGVTTSTSGWNTDASTQKISALKPYLWNYERIEYTLTSATTTNPTIIGTYGSKGDKGEDAQYLKLESSVRSIKCLSDKRNYAIPYNQTIYIEAKTSGIEGATFEWGTSTDDYSRVTRSVAGATYIIEFTKGAWEESLTKAPYIDINCKAKVNGTVIAEESINISSIPSGGEEGVYAGSFATSTEAENYITDEFITLTSGDSYLDISLNEDGTVKNIPMTWNGGSWEETNSYSKNYANTLSSALSDALTSGNAIQENTILWLWCKNLVAENAIINNLFSKKLSIMEDGEIASDNYYAIPAVDRRFRIKADGEAEFYGIKVGNAQIDGNSDFNGTITSGPLSTTLEKGGTSGSYSISYDSSTPYWKYSELESLLDNAGFTDGYTNISGTYSELHKGYGETALSTYTTQYNVYHNPVRDQYLRINLDVGRTIATCTMSNGINPDTGALYGDEWMKANVITRTYRFNKFRKLGSGDYPNNGSIYIHLGKKGDVTIYDAFNTYYSTKYIFWKADGTCLEPKTYNQGAITINSITPTYLYRWNGNSTSSGNLNVTGTATIRNTDSSINIANKSIIALYWSSANSLTITDSDYNKHTITTNDYFYALQIDYTVKTTINSVSTVTILPKNSVSNIGSNDEKFDVGYFNTANITTINATTVNATLNGNVNSSSSSEDLKVYRAVFN